MEKGTRRGCRCTGGLKYVVQGTLGSFIFILRVREVRDDTMYLFFKFIIVIFVIGEWIGRTGRIFRVECGRVGERRQQCGLGRMNMERWRQREIFQEIEWIEFCDRYGEEQRGDGGRFQVCGLRYDLLGQDTGGRVGLQQRLERRRVSILLWMC